MMRPFEYVSPNTRAQAISLLGADWGKAEILAGGTDLFIAMKEKGAAWENILDLKGIPDYDHIRETDGRIEIGALATIRSVETSPLLKEKIPFLAEAAGKIGSVQIRNRATLGGNLCNAAPSADTAPTLICLGAEGEIVEEGGARRIPLEDFFLGPGKTALRESALLTKVLIPLPASNSRGFYFKESPRRAMDLAVVGVSCLLTLDPARKKCLDCRIALGAVAPTPMRAKKAEMLLIGREVTEEKIAAAAHAASEEASPISDVRGSADFRREMVKVFVKRGVRELLNGTRS